MRMKKARIRNYRSIIDTGWFDVEKEKTIMVGPNEAGKTAVLQALQQINPPQDVPGFEPLRDYPRSKYSNDIVVQHIDPESVTVVEVEFELDDEDRSAIPKNMQSATYILGKNLDNTSWHKLINAPEIPEYGTIEKDLIRLCNHIDSRDNTETTDSCKSIDSLKKNH